MPKVRPGPGNARVVVPSTLDLAPGLLSSAERLVEASRLINGATPDPDWRYIGGEALAATWPPRGFGDTLAIQGSGDDPLLDQPSPLAGSGDEALVFRGGKSYIGQLAATGDIDTEDWWLRLLLQFDGTTNRDIASKPGRIEIISTGTQIRSYLVGVGGTFSVYTPTITPKAILLVDFFINPREASANGAVVYANGSAGTGVNVSTMGSLSTANPWTLGTYSTGTYQWTGALLYAHLVKQASWFQAGAAGPAEWLALHQRDFAAAFGTKPKRSRYSIAKPTAQGCTAAAHQPKRLDDGSTRLFLIGANTARHEKGQDLAGTPFSGLISEGVVTNGIIRDTDYLAGDVINGTRISDQLMSPWGELADILHEGTFSGSNFDLRFTAVSVASGTVYTLQATVRAINRTWVRLYSSGHTSGAIAYFNIGAGVLGATYQNCTPLIKALGNSWYRVSITYTANTTAGVVCNVLPAEGDNDSIYDGLDQDSIYCCSFANQNESYPGMVVKTAGAAATKPADAIYYPVVEGQEIGVGKGSMYVKFLGAAFTPAAGDLHILAELSDGGVLTDAIWCCVDSSGYVVCRSRKSGGADGDLSTSSSILDGHIHEILITWQANRFRLCVDGVWVTDDVLVDPPTGLDRYYLGSTGTPSYHSRAVRIIDAKPWNKVLTSWPQRLR